LWWLWNRYQVPSYWNQPVSLSCCTSYSQSRRHHRPKSFLLWIHHFHKFVAAACYASCCCCCCYETINLHHVSSSSIRNWIGTCLLTWMSTLSLALVARSPLTRLSLVSFLVLPPFLILWSIVVPPCCFMDTPFTLYPHCMLYSFCKAHVNLVPMFASPTWLPPWRWRTLSRVLLVPSDWIKC
jgi:hypothetical protein